MAEWVCPCVYVRASVHVDMSMAGVRVWPVCPSSYPLTLETDGQLY